MRDASYPLDHTGPLSSHVELPESLSHQDHSHHLQECDRAAEMHRSLWRLNTWVIHRNRGTYPLKHGIQQWKMITHQIVQKATEMGYSCVYIYVYIYIWYDMYIYMYIQCITVYNISLRYKHEENTWDYNQRCKPAATTNRLVVPTHSMVLAIPLVHLSALVKPLVDAGMYSPLHASSPAHLCGTLHCWTQTPTGHW